MKRFIAVALAVLLAFSLLPASALAVDGTIVVDTVEDTVDASDGVTSLREAMVSGWDKIAFHEDLKGTTITLTSPLRIGDKVVLELSGQTITAEYNTSATLATLWIMDGGNLTLQGEGTVLSAKAKDPDQKPTPFALYVREGGKLTVEGKASVEGRVSDNGEKTAYLIALERRTALTLTTEGKIFNGAFGVKAMNTASDYSVTINMKGEISSDVAMSLTDGPNVSIKQATLKGGTSALISGLTLAELAADGYQVFVGNLDTPATEEQMAATPAEGVTAYFFRKGASPTPTPEPTDEPTPEPSEEPTPEPVMYTVTYTDGQGHVLSTETVEAGTDAIPFSVSDENFTLLHWVDEDGNIYPVGTPFVVNDNMTLTAVWEEIKPTTYTVTFSTDGGSAVDAQTVEAGKSITLPSTSKEGFNFLHWKDANGTYSAGSAFTVNADVTLTAVWERILPPVTSLLWDGTKAVWGGVTGATGYKVQLYWNSQKLGEERSSSGTSFDFTADMTADGDYTYTVLPTADSAAGSWSAQSQANHIDRTAPVISDSYAKRVDEKTATFQFHSSEAGTYHLLIEATNSNPSADKVKESSNPLTCLAGENSYTLTDLSDAKARFVHIVAIDGNKNMSGVYTISIPAYNGPTATYTVTLPTGTGYTAKAASGSVSPVESGKSFSFTVTIADGYTKGTGFAVKANGTALAETGGTYTIANITANQTVTVEGVEAKPATYTVTLPTGTGYTAAASGGSTSPVNAGGSYSFTVSVHNGYARGASFAVKSNGVTVPAYNGVYTISNINASQTVTVTGIVVNQNTGGGGSTGTLPTQPTITTSLLPSATMGQEYKQQLTATGANPITWSYTGTLPEGITLNANTGLLSGTPTVEGSFRIAVKATNAGGTYTRQMTLVVVGSDYTVTEGNNAEWSQGSSDGLSFQGSGESAFTGVRIDGSAVPANQLTTSADGKTVTVSPSYLETLSTGSHTLTLVYPDGNAKAKFNIKAQSRTIPPSITAQPMSAEINEGSPAVFSVTASGTTPLLCQWQVDKQDGNGWTDIVGAVSASYTVDEVAADQNGWQYRCVITNTAGKGESNAATLTVKEAIGEITADTDVPARSNIGRILLFSALGVAAVGLAVGLVIYFRRRDDYME